MRALIVGVILLSIAVPVFSADVAGQYKGTWSGSAGASGEISMSLRPGANGAWNAEVSFTISGQDVKCNVTSVKVDGANVELVYDFAFGDTRLQSTATGELKGKTLEGTYKTKSLADGSAVDEGTWKAASA